MNNSTLLIFGALLFLAGGLTMALVAGPAGTSLGTTGALAGVALLGWGWIARSAGRDDDS